MSVTAVTIPLRAAQNHSDPGPMNTIPSVSMNLTSASLHPAATMAGRYGVRGQRRRSRAATPGSARIGRVIG